MPGQWLTRETPIEMVQLGIDPIVTSIVKGQVQVDQFSGYALFPRVTVPAWKFSYVVEGDEALRSYDGVERAMRAPIVHGDQAVSVEDKTLKRYSFRSGRDVDEIANAGFGYDLQAAAARFAKNVVDLAIERKQRDLAVATSSYASGHVLTIAGGSEWDQAAGDVFTDVDTQASLITAKIGVRKGFLKVRMADSAFRAALADDKFREMSFRQGIVPTNEAALATYLGVMSVEVMNPIEVDDTGAIGQLYGDVTIIYYDGGNVQGAPLLGANLRQAWGATANWNGGVANVRFPDEARTTWWWPWTDYALPFILNTKSAALIKNCSSLV